MKTNPKSRNPEELPLVVEPDRYGDPTLFRVVGPERTPLLSQGDLDASDTRLWPALLDGLKGQLVDDVPVEDGGAR